MRIRPGILSRTSRNSETCSRLTSGMCSEVPGLVSLHCTESTMITSIIIGFDSFVSVCPSKQVHRGRTDALLYEVIVSP